MPEKSTDPGTGPRTTPVETLPIRTSDNAPAALADVDVVLPILHGPFGEDGTVQGLLELAGVPYVGAGVAASALAMDKDLFKKVMRDSGIPVARHVALRLGDEIRNPFGYPVFVKPARLGSSVGISKVHDESELDAAVELARRHDEKVLVEEFVAGMEVECGVLGNRVPPPVASLPGRIDTLEHEWYDYASKYDEGGMNLVVPPELPQETIERVQHVAVDAFVVERVRGDGARRLLRSRRRRGRRQRAEHDPRFHGDERLREALRGVGDSVRGAPRPARRARARAPRAPLEARVLTQNALGERFEHLNLHAGLREQHPAERRPRDDERRGRLDSVTVAVVGRSVTSEISPKKSPASNVFTFLPLRRTSALPSSRTKNCRPGSSSLISTLPSARSISSAIFATSPSARFERPPKSGTRLSSSVLSGALRLRIAPILRREQVARVPLGVSRLADPGLAELDAEVDLAAGRRLGELKLHAARGAFAVLPDDVCPAWGEDDGVEPEVALRTPRTRRGGCRGAACRARGPSGNTTLVLRPSG